MRICGTAVAVLLSIGVFAHAEQRTMSDALTESLSQEERLVEDRANHTRIFDTSVAQDFVVGDSGALIGQLRYVQSVYEDTLVDIARVNGLGYEEIRLANPEVDAWLPGEGTQVRLPTQFLLPKAARRGLVINIAEYRMYYFVPDGDRAVVKTFPISIGRMDWGTPLGRASVVKISGG